MSKTLGQINEDAFLEKWHTIPDDTKVGVGRLICFEAAAEAVVKHLGEVPCGIDCGRSRAVIEAAKAWLPWAKSRMFLCPEEIRIVKALDALAELEVETPVPLDKVKTWEGES